MQKYQKVVSVLIIAFVILGCGDNNSRTSNSNNEIDTIDTPSVTIDNNSSNFDNNITQNEINTTVVIEDNTSNSSNNETTTTIYTPITDRQTNNSSSDSNKVNNFNGSVVDGELVGAKIFLDLNLNGKLDSGEPNATTDENGSYNLTLSRDILDNKEYKKGVVPLIAIGGKDKRSQKVFNGKLLAPAIKSNTDLTPISSILASSILKNRDKLKNISDVSKHIAKIKKHLSKLFSINERLLDTNPIKEAKDNNSLELLKLAIKLNKLVDRLSKDKNTTIINTYQELGTKFENDKNITEILDDTNLSKDDKDSIKEELLVVDTTLDKNVTEVTDDILDTLIQEIEDNITKEKVTILSSEITDKMAIRFLNKATFGATLADIKHLKEVGVEKWLDEQLAMPKSDQPYLRKTIEVAKSTRPARNIYSVEEYLADNDIVFNKNAGSFHSPRFRLTSWYENVLNEKDQLRHKVAYALSQIIVESDFEPIFTRRAEAIARYFDILYDNALGSYKKLLTDISFNSGMSMFLTFNGSKKHYKNSAGIDVYPDENYAREIMQLFAIGLNKLRMDGTPIKDEKGNLIPTYTQEDVNELARVFTGFDIKRNSRYGLVGFLRGDLTHRVEFTQKYHDFGAKNILGETIPTNLGGDDDVKSAIDIIFHQSSVAPYIAKKLIMRLTKSNPSPNYIRRVALAFKNSNFDLKATIKAIFLDPELWDDLKNDRIIKFKEPQIAMTQFLRNFYTKPMPKWYFCGYGHPEDENASNCDVVTNHLLFNDTRDYLGQGAGLAPTVFNFYDDSFIPSNEQFKNQKLVAPELQIQTDSVMIKFSNQIYIYMAMYEKENMVDKPYWKNDKLIKYNSFEEFFKALAHNILYYVGADKIMIDAKDEYAFTEKFIDGDTNGDFVNLDSSTAKKALKAFIDFEDKKLTGGMLSQEEKDILYDKIKDTTYNPYLKEVKRKAVYERIIVPVVRSIVTSSKYMVE